MPYLCLDQLSCPLVPCLEIGGWPCPQSLPSSPS